MAATVGARTEHIALIPSNDGPAEVMQIEHLGSENHLHVKLNGHHLVTLAPLEQSWRPGERAQITLHQPVNSTDLKLAQEGARKRVVERRELEAGGPLRDVGQIV